MGLFGLSNAEALIIAEQMRSVQARENRELQEEIHDAQMKQREKEASMKEKLDKIKIAQLATEARKTEPLITLTQSLYDGDKSGEKICVRASDIKEIKGRKISKEREHYDESCFQCLRKEWENVYETVITLWDFSVIHVKETPEEIQEKINNSIRTVNEAEARILKEVFTND